jgi:hypothetical protein
VIDIIGSDLISLLSYAGLPVKIYKKLLEIIAAYLYPMAETNF